MESDIFSRHSSTKKTRQHSFSNDSSFAWHRLSSIVEKLNRLWPRTFILLCDHFKSGDEFLPASVGGGGGGLAHSMTIFGTVSPLSSSLSSIPFTGWSTSSSTRTKEEAGLLLCRTTIHREKLSQLLWLVHSFLCSTEENVFTQLWAQSWGKQEGDT